MTPGQRDPFGGPAERPEDEPDTRPLLGSFAVGSGPDRVFRDSLKMLRDTAPDDATADLYDDILAGRRSPRDLFESDAFRASATAGIRQVRERQAALTPEEQERAAEESTAFFERGY